MEYPAVVKIAAIVAKLNSNCKLKIFGDVYYSGLKDKEQEKNLSIIGDYLRVSKWELYLLEIENERGMPIEKLIKLAEKEGLKPRVLERRIKVKELGRPSVITGSFYLGGLVERG
jgi:dihydrofolate synthase/folylpolyglutamate synthase